GQSVGAYTDATHGMTLAAVSLPYYRYIMPFGVKKFARFAREVWGISADGKTDEQLAAEGLDALENWMKELGLVMKISELGVTDDMIEGIADGTLILSGGYKQ
ncbi:MAG TPA: NADH-dependent alcohol dehydrogenase, partial [Ruminococcus sp.]|nr:NADH-dependent alcohol dehydrogenase [Ruminococcus sp.]